MKFKISSRFQPTGDQPEAIKKLVEGIESGKKNLTLLGVTGSGKSLGYKDLVYLVKKKNSISSSMIISIGKFIDSYDEDKSTEYFAQSYDHKTGKVSLQKISSFTKHKPTENMYELETKCGRSATFTGDHNLWVLRKGELVLIKTSDAKESDFIPIPKTLKYDNKSLQELNLIEFLFGGRFFIDQKDIIVEYIDNNGVSLLASSMLEAGIKSPYAKISAIKNNFRGSGININVFNHLLKKTNNFNSKWDPKNSYIVSKSRKHVLPATIVIDDYWLRFFGLFIAEGCIQERYSVIANISPNIRQFIKDFLSKKIKMPYLIRPSGDFQISSSLLTKVLNLTCGKKAINKHLPNFWPNIEKNQLGTLLQAYYDGDGTVSKSGEIIATTKSKKLASDLMYSLLKLGIWARTKKKWKKATNSKHYGGYYYFISLSGKKNLQLFKKYINFSLKHKSDRLNKFLNKKSNTNVDVIPNIGKQLLWLRTELNLYQIDVVKNSLIGRSELSQIENEKRNPSSKTSKYILINLKKYAEKKQNLNENWWNKWNDANKLTSVHWSQIKKVAKICYKYPFVYDLTVPGPETFLAGFGGFFVHNTFTMANVIEKVQKPTLIIAHNKTLAAQLYQEFRDFFPDNAVSYFVSYYDYYQPEAYIPTTDTYIEKEATINDEIDRLRLSSTTNLLTRPDSIVIASVSCIYNLGSPVEYGKYRLELVIGQVISRETLLLQLSNLQYGRSEAEFTRGTYRIRGDSIQLWPAYEDNALRIDTLANTIESITWINPITGSTTTPNNASIHRTFNPEQQHFVIYPAKHYMMNPKAQVDGIIEIKKDLKLRVEELQKQNKMIEAYRIEQKVNYDLEQMQEFGFVNGIENYSRYFDNRSPGDPPFTLIDYFEENAKEFGDGKFLTIIDESHMTLPQIKGMYLGDQARKQTLIDYGFRLPSALDNRPLKINEFMDKTKIKIYASATPKETEILLSGNEVIEQLIRPTGLVDSNIELRPTTGQIEDLIVEVIKRKQIGQRVLVTTLTKKMSEALTNYLNDKEKIDQLLKNYFSKKQKVAQAIENGDDFGETTIWQQEELPIDQMEIGKIDPKYFSHLHPSGCIKNAVKTADQIDPEVDMENIQYPKVAYLHSDIDTLDRSDILDDLRRGEYDVLIGINLLREGLDLPEVSLVAILDADKEGFLRSRTSMIQTMGRGARHIEGHSILYADRLTGSMKQAIEETLRRRNIQIKHNLDNGIDPQTIIKPIRDKMIKNRSKDNKKKKKGSGLTPESEKPKVVVQLKKGEQIDLNKINPDEMTPDDKLKLTTKLKRRMGLAVKEMDFELAAIIRDVIKSLE